MKKICDACGSPLAGGIGIGGAIMCRTCAEDVRAEIDKCRAEGKPVNAVGIAREIFRSTHSAGAYQLRDIPEKLWDRVKHKAIDEKMSIRELILDRLEKTC